MKRLEVLPRGVHDFTRYCGGECGYQRLEAADPQRVHAPDLIAGRQLQQAQLWKEGAFSQEFGVDADRGMRFEGARERRQFLASIDPNRVGHTIDPRVQFDDSL